MALPGASAPPSSSQVASLSLCRLPACVLSGAAAVCPAVLRLSYGVDCSALSRLVRAAFDLLVLLTFFTAGEDPVAVARPLPRGFCLHVFQL